VAAAALVAVLGSAVAWGTVLGQSPVPSQAVAALPVRIVEGSCEEPGDRVMELSDAMALETVPDADSLLYLSLTDADQALDQLAVEGRALLAGGSDAASAIACAGLGDLAEVGAASVMPLSSLHASGHTGVALFRGSDDGTVIEVVVVSPMAPAGSPAASPSGSATTGSAAPNASGLSPVRSAEPGTSGAPPFSPLPAGSTAP
jgi:hypothetical protein